MHTNQKKIRLNVFIVSFSSIVKRFWFVSQSITQRVKNISQYNEKFKMRCKTRMDVEKDFCCTREKFNFKVKKYE